MAATPLTREPETIVAGDTLAWTCTVADYPAGDGWTLRYSLVSATASIAIASSASGDDHAISVPAATSADWAAGTYRLVAYVTNAVDERHTLYSGQIVIKPNLAAAASGLDVRSTARKALDAVDAWIAGRDLAVAEYEIAGRRMKYIPMPELLRLRSRLQAEVASEAAADRLAAGLAPKNRILVRF